MTLLIKNVEILKKDKTVRGDVLIKDNKISAIGNFSNKKADEAINGLGNYLSPGFIDINTTSDRHLSLLTSPSQEDFLSQGVTTIVGGQAGYSLAPILRGRLGDIRYWTNVNKVNIDWQSTKELLKYLSKRRLGVNFATLVGYQTLDDFIGDSKELNKKNFFRNSETKEISLLKSLLENSLASGAYGLSWEVSREETAFGRGLPQNILKEILPIIKNKKGILAPHFENGRNLSAQIKEILDISEGKKVKILLSHFLPILKEEGDYENALNLIQNENNKKIYFDLFPFNENFLPIINFLPLWARRPEKIKEIRDPWFYKKVLDEMPPPDSSLIISEAYKNNFLIGKNLKEVAKDFGVSTREAILKVMILTEFKAMLILKNINLELVSKTLNHPKALIASHAASGNGKLKPERIKTFARFLNLVLENNLMTLPEAIKKITFTPAQFFGFQKRGLIEEGYFADLVLFSLDEKFNPEIKATIVNGEIAFREGEFKSAGRILRHEL